jgi:mannose-6-phosphate isomerase
MRTTKPEQVYEERPWGNFVRLSHNEPCSVKIITVKAGKRLSLQSHNKRSELWRVLDGPMTVQLGDEIQSLQRDEEVFIPVGTKHRACGEEVDGRWLEISFGDFDEDDIIRYEDDFGRG